MTILYAGSDSDVGVGALILPCPGAFNRTTIRTVDVLSGRSLECPPRRLGGRFLKFWFDRSAEDETPELLFELIQEKGGEFLSQAGRV